MVNLTIFRETCLIILSLFPGQKQNSSGYTSGNYLTSPLDLKTKFMFFLFFLLFFHQGNAFKNFMGKIEAINSLWPSDAMWRYRTGSTLAQVITSTNVDLSSVKSFGIHLRAISHEMLKISSLDVSLKITNLRLHPHLPGTNELSLGLCVISLRPSDTYTLTSIGSDNGLSPG